MIKHHDKGNFYKKTFFICLTDAEGKKVHHGRESWQQKVDAEFMTGTEAGSREKNENRQSIFNLNDHAQEYTYFIKAT